MNGLLVLQAMLGNSDLKDEQNAIYKLDEPFEGAKQWYVARDLGQTFGRTGVLDAPRGDIDVFEQTPFITGVVNGRVQFDYRGRHDALFDDITPADVRWICARLQTLTDEQWHDAFRAGGFAETDRRSLHPPPEAEDRRRPGAEGLIDACASRPRLVLRPSSPPLRAVARRCRAAAAAGPPSAQQAERRAVAAQDADDHPIHPLHEIDDAMVRLPLAAAARRGAGAAAAAARHAAAHAGGGPDADHPRRRRRGRSCWSSAPAWRARSASSAPPT